MNEISTEAPFSLSLHIGAQPPAPQLWELTAVPIHWSAAVLGETVNLGLLEVAEVTDSKVIGHHFLRWEYPLIKGSPVVCVLLQLSPIYFSADELQYNS